MKILLTKLFILILCFNVFAQESITGFDEKNVDILNEELRKLRGEQSFVSRGSLDSVDFAVGDLTCDSSWYELDLSDIIESDQSAVLVHVNVKDEDAPHSGIQFTEHDNSNRTVAWAVCNCPEGNKDYYYTVVVPCFDKFIDYAADTGLETCNITIIGWWR